MTTFIRRATTRSSLQPVVLVHGLFLGRWALSPLAQKLAAAGFSPHRFGYATVTGSLARNIAALHRTVLEVVADAGTGTPVHFVCHSLGGLLLRHLLACHPDTPAGVTVMLGTPNQGSHVARTLHRLPLVGALLAPALAHGLDGSAPPWPRNRPLAMVVGTLPAGAGRLVPGLAKPNDGTVAVAETACDGAGEIVRLPVSHTGMLFSVAVARAVIRVLTSAP